MLIGKFQAVEVGEVASLTLCYACWCGQKNSLEGKHYISRHSALRGSKPVGLKTETSHRRWKLIGRAKSSYSTGKFPSN